jgi:mono/diheme cytochrome c family protein
MYRQPRPAHVPPLKESSMKGRFALTSVHRHVPLLAIAAGLLLGAVACGDHKPAPDASSKAFDNTAAAKADPTQDLVARGKYLAAVGGCSDCHTPRKMGPKGPEPDMSRYLSGHPAALKMPPPPKLAGPWMWAGAATNTAYAGPWGVSYAINLTPDEETGIGVWTPEVFVAAIKTGQHLGVGRPIMPPMPWSAYAQMTEDDLRAIFAYLKSLPPAKNRAPEGEPAPPPAS